MKRFALLLALLSTGGSALLTTSCDHYNAAHYREEFANYYKRPAEETISERKERREIVHWAENPKDKKRIGFLHTWETMVKGSREYRDSFYIMDRYGATRIGFITAEGKFYRFDKEGQLGTFVGEYTIVTTGLKVFFGIPLREHLDLEEIDPYK